MPVWGFSSAPLLVGSRAEGWSVCAWVGNGRDGPRVCEGQPGQPHAGPPSLFSQAQAEAEGPQPHPWGQREGAATHLCSAQSALSFEPGVGVLGWL